MKSKTNLVDKAYAAIKSRIITYQLKPGAVLSIDNLSKSLEMSQTPIREALNRLNQEHFVERYGSKGYMASSLDTIQIEHLYEMRIILEVPAIRLAASHISEEGLAELSNILTRVEFLIKEQRRAEILKLEREFHLVILKHSGNSVLYDVGESILDRVSRVQNINALTSDRFFTVQESHSKIYLALKSRSLNEAVKAMEEHLISAKEYVLARLNDDDDILCKLL